jgi:tetratricopeptide (TPR) repeat protein
MYETDSNTPPNEVLHHARVDIVDSKGNSILKRYPVFPSLLFRGYKDDKVVYSGNFNLFWNFRTKDNLIFEEPGRYKVVLSEQGDLGPESREPLIVEVKAASKSDSKALALLSDPNDYAFLELGEHEYPERHDERLACISRLVGNQPNSIVGKWGAARLGLEYYERFLASGHNLNETGQARISIDVKDEYFKKALKYLDIGYMLPDEMPIREETVYKLAGIEARRGNRKRAITLLDELIAKYPYGEYGRRAATQKEAIQALEPIPIIGERPLWGRGTVIIPTVLGLGIMIVAIIYLVRRSQRIK